MNLNNIQLDYAKDGNHCVIEIYVNKILIPIHIIKGIEYFDYIDEKGSLNKVSLNKKNWAIVGFRNDDEEIISIHKLTRTNQGYLDLGEIKVYYSESELELYYKIGEQVKKQYQNLDLALLNGLKLYIKFYIERLKEFGIKTNFKCIDIEEIRNLLKEEKLWAEFC